MYVLPAAGGPSFIIHGLIALGAAIGLLALKAYKKIFHV